jgi:segregation and condensation protein B
MSEHSDVDTMEQSPVAEAPSHDPEARTEGEVETETEAADDLSGERSPEWLMGAVEAVLFVVEAPVSLTALATALHVPVPEVSAAVLALTAEYDRREAGIEVRAVAAGVRIYTRPAHAPVVEAFLQDGQRTRLTQAALETLAVVAYRQPITRARVSAIRGVNVDGVVRTLTTRGLIVEAGADPDTGGGLLQTTDLFLERMGLTAVAQLPSLAPLLPEIDGLEIDEL